jgi:hypothetical protein
VVPRHHPRSHELRWQEHCVPHIDLRQLRHFPPKSPELSQMSRLSQGPMIILRPLRTEVSQVSRVLQWHLPEQRSARLPRQMAPQRGRP